MNGGAGWGAADLAVLCGLGVSLLGACLVTGCSSAGDRGCDLRQHAHRGRRADRHQGGQGRGELQDRHPGRERVRGQDHGGQVPGNGGGAPVVVSGWTCQGYDTPEVLRTGNASQCHSGGTAILAVLPVPDATKTAA